MEESTKLHQKQELLACSFMVQDYSGEVQGWKTSAGFICEFIIFILANKWFNFWRNRSY